jgi:malate synthase
MADFEDANSPTWANQVGGHVNLVDAIEGTIEYSSSEGKEYSLVADPATLLVRPRGLHLPEKHLRIDSDPVAGALFDFGMHAFHGGRRLAERGRGVFFYLPKLEHHLEARWWDDAFTFAEEAFGLERGTLRATVLIETLPAAFQMDEILWELRDHSLGLNAGRWDYIFSMIKCFRERPEFVLPDRNDVKMTVPFMRAYTELLVKTCHARGAFAMGGMAALIPSRKDPEANDRSRPCAPTSSARPRPASTAPGSRTRTSCRSRRRSSTACSGRSRTRSRGCATTSRSARRTCSTRPRRRARSPRRACATTSTSASSTSRSGSAGAARPASTG